MVGLVRAYAPPASMRPISRRKHRKQTPWLPAALLVFDCETSTDHRQQLTFGFWRFHRLVATDEGLLQLVCVDEGIAFDDMLPKVDPDGFQELNNYRLRRCPETDPFTVDASTELRFLSRAEFVEKVLIPVMEDPAAVVCGFNLAYDLSRPALVAERARRHRIDKPDMLEGGFSLGLESYLDMEGRPCKESPHFGRVRIRSLDSKKHLFEWTRAGVRHNGHFLDARMLGFGLSGEAGSLERSCERFGVIDPAKLERALDERGFSPAEVYCQLRVRSSRELASQLLTDPRTVAQRCVSQVEQGEEIASLLADFDLPFEKRPVMHGRITTEYVSYARSDTWATGELCWALLRECWALGLTVQPTKIFSPASVAKDLYDRLGIRPLLERYPKLSPRHMGYAMSAFFGGRAECRIRKVSLPCVIADATSMYPAASVAMDLHRFDSRQLTVREIAGGELDELQAFLDRLTVDQLHLPEVHPGLVFFAEIDPQPGDILPVRAPYGGDGEHGIGVNEVESSIKSLWYAGPDLAALKVLSQRSPRLKRALVFEFGRRLPGLRAVELPDGTTLDPRSDDPNQRLIEARKRLEKRQDLSKADRLRADRFFKVVANSLYGSSAEMNREELREPVDVDVYGVWQFRKLLPTPEIPGSFFNPFRAALTTAWARLMLGLLERRLTSTAGSYIAMDTDSMLIVSARDHGLHACPGGPHQLPDGSEAVLALSWEEVERLLREFDPIRQFDTDLVPDFWKIEKINYEGGDPHRRRRQLSARALAAKRYSVLAADNLTHLQPVAIADGDDTEAEVAALIDLDREQGQLASLELVDRREHGLGHLLDPSDPSCDSRDWITDAWTYLEAGARGERPAAPNWFALPAMSRITLSTPDLRKPFEAFNRDRLYRDAIKPFNFVMRPQPKLNNKPAGTELPSLVAAYNDDPTTWLGTPYFNINDKTGTEWTITTKPVDPGESHTIRVKTYGEVINSYWDHEEAKSLAPNGEPCRADTRGLLQRRRIKLVHLQHLGKEGNKLEQREHGLVGSTADYLNTYDDPNNDLWTLYMGKAMPAFTTAEIGRTSQRGPGPVLVPGVREALDATGQPVWSGNEPVPERTIRDARRRRPDPTNERLITAAVVRLAAEALQREGIAVPRTAPGSPFVDELACLSLFTEETWRCIRGCALPGCDKPARPRSCYCSEAHKKKAARRPRLTV
jgi:hypothetical protein